MARITGSLTDLGRVPYLNFIAMILHTYDKKYFFRPFVVLKAFLTIILIELGYFNCDMFFQDY
jgi:hypothetical protein